jgi:hypothetical protein
MVAPSSSHWCPVRGVVLLGVADEGDVFAELPQDRGRRANRDDDDEHREPRQLEAEDELSDCEVQEPPVDEVVAVVPPRDRVVEIERATRKGETSRMSRAYG